MIAYKTGFDKRKTSSRHLAGGFFGVSGGVCVYSKKNKRGRNKGAIGSSMVAFKVTRKMRKNASPDNYELTEEEREAIIARNLSNSNISNKIKKKYQRKKIW